MCDFAWCSFCLIDVRKAKDDPSATSASRSAAQADKGPQAGGEASDVT